MKSRHKQCIEALTELGEATAREVATYLYNKGYTNLDERNIAHPRLNELVEMGEVTIIGKKLDTLTQKEVNVYKKVL